MKTAAVILKPIVHGWAVTLTDGRELVRFTGLWAKRRALRYLASTPSTISARPAMPVELDWERGDRGRLELARRSWADRVRARLPSTTISHAHA